MNMFGSVGKHFLALGYTHILVEFGLVNMFWLWIWWVINFGLGSKG